MKRSMWGITLFAASAGLWACNGDPTGDLREGEKIIADPTSVFINEGATKFVTVELVDGQGNQLATEFAAQDIAGGITVEEDPTFLQTTIGTRLPTQERFVVTGLTPSVSSFVVTAGDTSLTVPVRVLPTSFGATFSNAAPAQNEAVTVTAPEGFDFSDVSGVVLGADTGVVLSHAEDGNSFTFVARPGLDTLPTRNIGSIIGVTSDLYSSVPLTLPTLDSITVAPAAQIAGTEDPAAAPTIAAPGVGQTAAFFDRPDFADENIDHFYKLNVTEAGDYTITVDWTVGNDVDAPLCVSDPTCAAETFTDPTVSGNKPESGTFTLPVGVHTLLVEDFGQIQGQFPGFSPGTPAIGALISIKIVRL
jgi:hypothetical protein